MAYGNYGAWVFRDGEHMPQWEDQTPYHEEDLVAGYHQAFGVGTSDDFPLCHAVLGGAEMRLCARKTYPHLYWRLEEVEPWQNQDRGAPEYETTYPPLRSYVQCDPSPTPEWVKQNYERCGRVPPTSSHHYHDEDPEARYHGCWWVGEMEGYHFAIVNFDNRLHLALIEPTGAVWQAISGYCFGAGWYESPIIEHNEALALLEGRQ